MALRLFASLLFAAGFGCATLQTMIPQETSADAAVLPGGDGPLRSECRMLADTASRQIPIQFRDQLGPSVATIAFDECMGVLLVMVSVAMDSGDTTGEGVQAVRVQIAGAESQYLADTCDEHYRAYRFLRDPHGGYQAALDDATTAEYDGWMDRCYRVLRPLSLAAAP